MKTIAAGPSAMWDGVTRTALSISILGLLAGCASDAQAPESLTLARSQVVASGSDTQLSGSPEARLHIAAAQDKLALAERALDEDDELRANLLAREALAEVGVARAKARADEAQAAAADVERTIEALRAETQRRGSNPQQGSATSGSANR